MSQTKKSSTPSGSSHPYQESGTSRYGGLSSKRGMEHASFVEGDHQLLARCLDAIIEEGDAVIIGRTSDKASICITILEGDVRHKEYAVSQTQLDSLIEDLSLALKA